MEKKIQRKKFQKNNPPGKIILHGNKNLYKCCAFYITQLLIKLSTLTSLSKVQLQTLQYLIYDFEYLLLILSKLLHKMKLAQ